MTRYQLAKIVSWAGDLQARKRLQKVVYLLQSAGCPLQAEFSLHHYGPYSEELARLTDEMVRQSLLVEQSTEHSQGKQFSYRLSPAATDAITDLEATESGRQWAHDIAAFEMQAKALLVEDLKQLEYASTIVYFRRQGEEWEAAVAKAAAFKRTGAVSNALHLARQLIA